MGPNELKRKVTRLWERLANRIAQDTMTPQERVTKLMNFEEPDRLPGPTGLAESFAAKHAGFTLSEVCSDAKNSFFPS